MQPELFSRQRGQTARATPSSSVHKHTSFSFGWDTESLHTWEFLNEQGFGWKTTSKLEKPGCQRDCELPTGTAEAKAQGLWARSWLRLFVLQSSALAEGTELAAPVWSRDSCKYHQKNEPTRRIPLAAPAGILRINNMPGLGANTETGQTENPAPMS